MKTNTYAKYQRKGILVEIGSENVQNVR